MSTECTNTADGSTHLCARPAPPLRLGCAVYAHGGWRGQFLPLATSTESQLLAYAQRLNAVEGNSSFYALPAASQWQRWRESTPPGFKFVMKFPRVISHDLELVGSASATAKFLDLLALLEDRAGPPLLQLGPGFDGRKLAQLERYLDALPRSLVICVEARHRDYFDQARTETLFDSLLRERGHARCLFDTSEVHRLPADDPSTAESQRRKPRVPVRSTQTNSEPVVRLVLRNRIEQSRLAIERWAEQLGAWLRVGLAPLVLIHTPDDQHMPAGVAALARAVRARGLLLEPMFDWTATFAEAEPEQTELWPRG